MFKALLEVLKASLLMFFVLILSIVVASVVLSFVGLPVILATIISWKYLLLLLVTVPIFCVISCLFKD